MKVLLRLLLSRKVAVLVILAMTGVLLAASFVPEVEPAQAGALRAAKPVRAFVAEQLHPAQLAQSPVFLVLPGFIALSVLASMWQRLGGHLRSRKKGGAAGLERHAVAWSTDLPIPPEEATARLRRGLRAAGFAFREPRPEARHGSRGAAGFWGSMAFHAGMLVALVGMCLSALGRCSGELVLAEGAPVVLTPGVLGYSGPPDRMRALEGTRVTLSDVSAAYASPTQLTDVAGLLAVERRGGEARQQLASVNVPVWIGDFQLTLHRYGFAPEIEARDPSGKVRASGMGTVPVQPPGAEDRVSLEGGGLLQLRLYPDYVERNGAPATRSPIPVRPVLGFRWMEGDRELAAGLVPRGGEVAVNGYRVAFGGLHYWADFLVSRDPGLDWFALGAFLCIAGLAARFTWPEQAWRAEVRPAPGGSHVEVALSARYHPALLQERLEKLERAVAGEESPG